MIYSTDDDEVETDKEKEYRDVLLIPIEDNKAQTQAERGIDRITFIFKLKSKSILVRFRNDRTNENIEKKKH